MDTLDISVFPPDVAPIGYVGTFLQRRLELCVRRSNIIYAPMRDYVHMQAQSEPWTVVTETRLAASKVREVRSWVWDCNPDNLSISQIYKLFGM